MFNRKGLQFGEEGRITGPELLIFFIEDSESGFTFFQVCGTPYQAMETLIDPFPEPVMIQPVLPAHIGEHPVEGGREPGSALLEIVVGAVRKLLQFLFRGEDQVIVGEEMIVHHIGECAGIQTIMRSEYRLEFAGGFMGIGELIDGPVEPEANLYLGRVGELFLPFHEIADHIAQEDLGQIERQIGVRQVIHTANFANGW